MSRNQPLLLVVLLLSWCAAHAKPTPTSWSVHVPKVGGTIKSLTLKNIPLPTGVSGAESLAFDRRGEGPYAGVSDGRVLKLDGSTQQWRTFAYNENYENKPMCTASPSKRPEGAEAICGRPLGLQFDAKTGDLYIADAYLGLMKVGPGGGKATVLVREADGVPFNFVNGVDVDQATGDIYFTDSSTTYTREHNTMIMGHHDATGRLLKYNARTRHVTVLKSGLPYPNGVAVSVDRTHVVVAHTGPCQAFRYWLKGPKAGNYELFTNLPGYVDNVRRDAKGGYWFALNREQINATSPEHLVGVQVDAKGAEHGVMTAPKGVTLSDISEKDGKLWLGSVELDHVVIAS